MRSSAVQAPSREVASSRHVLSQVKISCSAPYALHNRCVSATQLSLATAPYRRKAQSLPLHARLVHNGFFHHLLFPRNFSKPPSQLETSLKRHVAEANAKTRARATFTSKNLASHPVEMMLVQKEMYWPPFNRSPGTRGASRFTSFGPSPSLESSRMGCGIDERFHWYISLYPLDRMEGKVPSAMRTL